MADTQLNEITVTQQAERKIEANDVIINLENMKGHWGVVKFDVTDSLLAELKKCIDTDAPKTEGYKSHSFVSKVSNVIGELKNAGT